MKPVQKFDAFVGDLGVGVHNLNDHELKILLTNARPRRSDGVKNDVAEIPAGNGYEAGGSMVPNSSYAQTAGIGRLRGDDVVFTASGGSIGPFRCAVLYNAGSARQALIGWWDYGKTVTLNERDTFTVDLQQQDFLLEVV